MKRIIAWTILAVSAGISGLSHAAFINDSIGGTMDDPDIFFDVGFVGESGFLSEATLAATGSVSKFNIVGAVLLSYTINGTLVLESDGLITIPIANNAGGTSAGGQVNAGAEFDPCDSVSIGPTTCDAVESIDFTISFTSADFADVVGTGSVAVSRTGDVGMSGGCTGPDCDNVAWQYVGSAALEGLRVEWAYCTTPGVDGCPLLVPGVNSPGQDATGVPEPATLALFGLGLAGLAASRRLRSKRRT